LYIANAGMNIASDVIIVALPLPAIHALPIPKGQKISLMVILVLGLL
jgi:hypothetical protein